jgi:hypothetical protein
MIKTVEGYRIVLEVDQEWLDTIEMVTDYAESGELMRWLSMEKITTEIDDGVEEEWEAVFVGDKYNEAWMLVDSDGNERQPSYWYNSKEEAEAHA